MRKSKIIKGLKEAVRYARGKREVDNSRALAYCTTFTFCRIIIPSKSAPCTLLAEAANDNRLRFFDK